MRRLLPGLIALAAAVAGCQRQDGEATAVIVIGDAAPALADPAGGPGSAADEVLLASVAQGLVGFDGGGQIVPGLAESWNVSDDGLSYIFRLATGDWPDGRPIHARDVARILKRQLRGASLNPLRDALGAVEDVVAMTDRVIEVRLKAPRPNLLQLLAQPQLGIVRERLGTGPFTIEPATDKARPGPLLLTQRIHVPDDADRLVKVALATAPAARAIAAFRAGEAELVLGGSFADLPLVPRDRAARAALRFDPVAGLFGLVPARKSGPLADAKLRGLLSRAIDRDALVAALAVPGLVARTTVLQGELEGNGVPVAPAWAAVPLAERRNALAAEARRLLGSREAPLALAIALPEGPGSELLLRRLAADWAPLGVRPVRAAKGVAVDLRLVDQVAPSASPAWFVRSFRCEAAAICAPEADVLMQGARDTLVGAQRAAMLAEAGRLIDGETLFLPLAAPVRWSLVGADLPGFAENIFARHPLGALRDKPGRERQ